MTDKEKIAHLEKQNLALREENKDLREKLQQLFKLISEQSVKKDSSNSSLPPSSDLKKRGSLRPKSDKPSGGQPGHKGKTLEMSVKPDEIVELKPEFCSACGQSLEPASLFLKGKRQLIDIPLPPPVVTEYRQYAGRCSCGCEQAADYPAGLVSSVQYGENIEAMIAYLSVNQYIPYGRMCAFFKEVFSLSLSQGTIANKLVSMHQKALPFYKKMRSELENSVLPVGSDETGCRVNAKNQWIWVWQNEAYCYLALSAGRGSATIREHFPEGFALASLSSDRWSAQLKTSAKQHQLCFAHLLRDLKYLQQTENHPFTFKLSDLFSRALRLKKEHKVFCFGSAESSLLEQELNGLLAETIPKENYPKTARLQRSMVKLRASIFPFLYEEKLSADNNASERAIRNVKVKMKVSGMFKSGGPGYTVLKSIEQTLKKKAQNLLEAFRFLAQTAPETRG